MVKHRIWSLKMKIANILLLFLFTIIGWPKLINLIYVPMFLFIYENMYYTLYNIIVECRPSTLSDSVISKNSWSIYLIIISLK